MKTKINPAIAVILALSVFFNIFLLCRMEVNQSEPIVKYSSDKHNIDIYIERAPDVKNYSIDMSQSLFSVGDVEIMDLQDSLRLFTDDCEINLSELGTRACIVKNNGEVLYHFEEYKESQTVFVTPSGKKYHYDSACAGGTAFQAPLEAAVLFREPCSICT